MRREPATQNHHRDQHSREIHGHVCQQDRVAHELLVLRALVASRVSQGHPAGVQAMGDRPTQPAVVSRERRVVQPPVEEIVTTTIDVPTHMYKKTIVELDNSIALEFLYRLLYWRVCIPSVA